MEHAFAPPALLLFVLASLVATGSDLWLRRRQGRFVAAHRDAVPAGFAHAVSLDEHRKAADYEIARLRFGAVETVVGCALGIAWAWFFYDATYAALAPLLPEGLGRSLGFLVAVAALSWLLDLPFSVLRVFWLEARFGFNRQTPGGYLADLAKGAALSAAIGVPLLAGLLWLMGRPGAWWLWAWMGLMALMLGMMHAWPRWIAPLFNTFTPLDGALRARIETLLQRCGFQAAGLFVMDASRRSSHGNAYFSGLGRAKRIVLFDTLIAGNTEDELEAVLAHELGHFKLNHIALGMLESAVTSFLGFAVVGWLCRQDWLLPSFGIVHQDPALALLVGMLLVQIGGPALGVVGNWISRVHEYQADDFARRMVGAAPMVSALVKLSRDNASTLTTDPLYALVHFSHPPVPQRVARLQQADQASSRARNAASSV